MNTNNEFINKISRFEIPRWHSTDSQETALSKECEQCVSQEQCLEKRRASVAQRQELTRSMLIFRQLSQEDLYAVRAVSHSFNAIAGFLLNRVNQTEKLPSDSLVKIFELLPWKDVCSVRLVSNRFNGIINKKI